MYPTLFVLPPNTSYVYKDLSSHFKNTNHEWLLEHNEEIETQSSMS